MEINTEKPKTMVEAVKAYEGICRASDPHDENWFAPDDMVRVAPIRTTEDLVAFIEFLKAEALADVGTDRTDIRTFDDIDGNGFDWEGLAVFKLAREAANFLPVTAEDLGIRLHEVSEQHRAYAIQDQANYRAEKQRIIDALTPIQCEALDIATGWPHTKTASDFQDHVRLQVGFCVSSEWGGGEIGSVAFRAKVQERADAIQDAFPELEAQGLVMVEADGFSATGKGRAIAQDIKNQHS